MVDIFFCTQICLQHLRNGALRSSNCSDTFGYTVIYTTSQLPPILFSLPCHFIKTRFKNPFGPPECTESVKWMRQLQEVPKLTRSCTRLMGTIAKKTMICALKELICVYPTQQRPT